MNLGERLKMLRKRLGLTQKQFAAQVDGKLDYTWIGKVERGQQYPSLKLLEKIGKAYSVPLAYFFEDEQEAKRSGFSAVDILNWLANEAEGVEIAAQNELEREHYLMYGCWKTVADYIKRMKKEFQQLIETRK